MENHFILATSSSFNLFKPPLWMYLNSRIFDHLVNRTKPLSCFSDFVFFWLVQISLDLNLHGDITYFVIFPFPLPIVIQIVATFNPLPIDCPKFESFFPCDSLQSCCLAGCHWRDVCLNCTYYFECCVSLVREGDSQPFFGSYCGSF